MQNFVVLIAYTYVTDVVSVEFIILADIVIIIYNRTGIF